MFLPIHTVQNQTRRPLSSVTGAPKSSSNYGINSQVSEVCKKKKKKLYIYLVEIVKEIIKTELVCL